MFKTMFRFNLSYWQNLREQGVLPVTFRRPFDLPYRDRDCKEKMLQQKGIELNRSLIT